MRALSHQDCFWGSAGRIMVWGEDLADDTELVSRLFVNRFLGFFDEPLNERLCCDSLDWDLLLSLLKSSLRLTMG